MTLEEIQQQIKALQEKAQNMIEAKKAEVISDIKEKIQAYGLTADELGLRGGGTQQPARAKAAPKEKAPALYRNEQGETWSGGRGKRPQWVSRVAEEAEKNGRDFKEAMSPYLIK